MGFKVEGQALNTAFKRFKEIADRKKQVTAMDLEALVTDELRSDDVAAYAFVDFEVSASSSVPPRARVNVNVEDTSRTRTVLRRRPGRRDLPAINAATGVDAAAARVPRRRRHRGPGRARRGLGRRRGRRPNRAPARASPRTSSRRQHAPTCGRSRSGSCELARVTVPSDADGAAGGWRASDDVQRDRAAHGGALLRRSSGLRDDQVPWASAVTTYRGSTRSCLSLAA